jgi:hypothetical protein
MSDKKKAPAVRAKVSNSNSNKAKTKPFIKSMKPSGEMIFATGREAQTLWHLMLKGNAGDTSLGFSCSGWARRTSAYIFELRLMGIDIHSSLELVEDGARVARYVLNDKLILIEAYGLGGQI